MPLISVRIPQMGEGLQEALLVEFLKHPGDSVQRDEPIYVMETDKATTDVESPYDGILAEWTAAPGTVLPIGSEVGKMEVAEGVREMPAGHGPPETESTETKTAEAELQNRENGSAASSPGSRQRTAVVIPPRTKKYLKEKGLLDFADQIPVAGKKMMPEDVDRYMAAGSGTGSSPTNDQETSFQPQSNDNFSDSEIPRSQITLNYRLQRGVSTCVPVTVMRTVCWDAIANARSQAKAEHGEKAASAFSMMLSCVVGAIQQHPKLRTTIVGDGRFLRTFHDVNLGIAVGLPGDELVTAVVPRANQLEGMEFHRSVKAQIDLARQGTDQADASVPVTVSNIGSAGMRWGIPAVVSPGIATIAVGEVYDLPVPEGDSFRFRKSADLTLSFDHRVLNGVGAADFMNELAGRIESFSL
ncbi:MAG: 2-oxo acid dehydrogenase subunit E2 [Planctomycetota bacterium]|nr:2-oxo acid dehydrogenase subunit E2 [Planctomycetota bacterium]